MSHPEDCVCNGSGYAMDETFRGLQAKDSVSFDDDLGEFIRVKFESINTTRNGHIEITLSVRVPCRKSQEEMLT